MDKVVAVVGLGYVGLPLAFGRVMPTIGFEISQAKVDAYGRGYDPTGEMEGEDCETNQAIGTG